MFQARDALSPTACWRTLSVICCFSASGRMKSQFWADLPLSPGACKGGRFSRPTPRSPFLDGQGRTAIASARRDPRESAICRILRCFEAVFQKGNLSKNRPEIISRVPQGGKGLYRPSGNHRGRREKKGGDKSCAPL